MGYISLFGQSFDELVLSNCCVLGSMVRTCTGARAYAAGLREEMTDHRGPGQVSGVALRIQG